MILPWMLYASVVALLLGLAAWVLEGVVRQREWPVRGLWVLALLGSVLVPLLAATVLPLRGPLPAAPPLQESAGQVLLIEAPMKWFEWPDPLGTVAAPGAGLDRWLLVLWAFASAATILYLVLSHRALHRRRREWRLGEVDGQRVWVSSDVGPAAVGFFRSDVVLPEWLLDAPASERALVLAHEVEHVRAGDPRLLLGALLMLTALPWNPALWWQWRRLCRAVEIDCDLRVLAHGIDPHTYSRLLVEVSERGTPHRLSVVALSESASSLERRIRFMLTPQSRYGWARAAGSTLLAAALVLTACRMDRPEVSPTSSTGTMASVDSSGSVARLKPPAAPEEASPLGVHRTEDLSQAPVFTPYDQAPAFRNRADLAQLLQQSYPAVLRDAGIGGTVRLWVFIDETGAVRSTRVVEDGGSGHSALDDAAQEAMQEVRFTPARLNEQPVPVWVQFPITFNAPGSVPRNP